MTSAPRSPRRLRGEYEQKQTEVTETNYAYRFDPSSPGRGQREGETANKQAPLYGNEKKSLAKENKLEKKLYMKLGKEVNSI